MIDFIDFSRKVKKLSGGSKQKTYVIKRSGKLFLRKTFDKNDSRKIRNQVRWFIKNQNEHIPRVDKYGNSFFVFYYDIPFYKNYIPFSDFVMNGDIDKSKNLIKNILKFMFKDFYIYEKSNNMQVKLSDYLKTRLIDRFQNISKINNIIRDLSKYDELIINGKTYLNASELINSVWGIKEKIVKATKSAVLNLHGDFTAENILCNGEDFILIDPDESPFNSDLVDLGKFFQSFHSKYELLIKLKECKVKGNGIAYKEPENENYEKTFKFICKEIRKYIPKEKFPLIIFDEAMHFSRMLPYKHRINPKLVPIFYANTIKLLNSFIHSFKS